MKFYIDDSMLARNEFATSVLHRFECWLEHHPADLILVSAARKDNPQLRHFVEAMQHTVVLASPAQFEFEGIRGDLRDGFLCVEGYTDMQSFSAPLYPMIQSVLFVNGFIWSCLWSMIHLIWIAS